MNKHSDKAISLGLCVLLAAPLVTCGGGDDSKPGGPSALAEHLEQGREYLITNQYLHAAEEFEAALGIEPYNTEAAYGHVIAEFGDMTDSIQVLLGLVMLVAGDLSVRTNPRPPDADPPDAGARMGAGQADDTTGQYVDENDQILGLIQDVLHMFVNPSLRLFAEIQALKDNPDAVYEIEGFTMHVLGQPMFEASGEWDGSDLKMLSGMVGMLGGAVLVAGSTELRLDVYDAAENAIYIYENRDTIDMVPAILNLVVQALMDDNYDFLGFSSQDIDGDGVADGEQFPAQAARMLSTAMADLAGLPAALAGELEADPEQADDILVLAPADDDEERRDVMFDDRIAVHPEEGYIQFTGEFAVGDLSIILDQTALDGMQALADNLAGPADGERNIVMLGDHLLPIVGVIVATVVKAIYIEAVSDYTAFIPESPRDLATLVSSFINGGAIGLDPGAFLLNPVTLKSLLPYYRTDVDPSVANVLLSWECPSALDPAAEPGTSGYFPDGSITCPDDSSLLEDSAHFGGAEWTAAGLNEIAMDGEDSRLPYIPFPDASLGGLLLIDESLLGLDNGGSGLALADNHAVNGLIASVAGAF